MSKMMSELRQRDASKQLGDHFHRRLHSLFTGSFTPLVMTLVFLCGSTQAVEFEPNPTPENWYTYSGVMGEASIALVFHLGADNRVVGHYTLASNTTLDMSRISFSGTLYNSVLSLSESLANKPGVDAVGSIAGFFYLDRQGLDMFKGHRKGSLPGELTDLALTLRTYSPGNRDKRFIDFHGADSDLEAYVRNVRDAILEGNKEWLADQPRYPIEHISIQCKKIRVDNRAQFLARFEEIFHPEFKDKLRQMHLNDLFATNGGVSLGGGVLRFYSTNFFPDRTSDSPRFFIYEFNT